MLESTILEVQYGSRDDFVLPTKLAGFLDIPLNCDVFDDTA